MLKLVGNKAGNPVPGIFRAKIDREQSKIHREQEESMLKMIGNQAGNPIPGIFQDWRGRARITNQFRESKNPS